MVTRGHSRAQAWRWTGGSLRWGEGVESAVPEPGSVRKCFETISAGPPLEMHQTPGFRTNPHVAGRENAQNPGVWRAAAGTAFVSSPGHSLVVNSSEEHVRFSAQSVLIFQAQWMVNLIQHGVP